MGDVVIRVEALGKKYRLGARTEPYKTLRDSLTRSAGVPVRSLTRVMRGRPEEGEPAHRPEFWALKNVSLEVHCGEVLGIIGRNGAGKSTLLKILSRITQPTEGRARVRGRVGSLLEVGTGFHPELTGRENVFLNGAVLGMSHTDIRRRFDEIVEFSGVERFLDTPVKHYSSGMQMRLAFAVAAHLEPEVLVVDEVLAVGDAEFQRKCLGKMSRVAGEGRTVLVVSHNLAMIERLCERVILLEEGRVLCDAEPRRALGIYLRSGQGRMGSADLSNATGRREGMVPVIRQLNLRDESNRVTGSVACGKPLIVELGYDSPRELQAPGFAILVETAGGVPVFHVPSEVVSSSLGARAPRRGRAVCRLNSLPLAPGQYSLRVGCRAGGEQVDLIEGALTFYVEPFDYYGTGKLPDPANGVVLLRGTWTLIDDASG